MSPFLKTAIEAAKAAPGKIKAGASGAGSIHHLNLLALENGTGAKFSFIPYKGSAPAQNAAMTGEISLVVTSLAEQQQLIRRALNELRADEQLKEMEMTLVFFASFVMQTTLIKQIMRWDMVVLQQSPWYQQILSEGREEGRQSVMRQLLRVLTHHFGEVPEQMKQQLNLLSAQQLETLTDAAFSVSGLDELQQDPLLAGL